MKNNNSNLPTADFFDFETYLLPQDELLSLEQNPSKTILIYLKGAKEEEIQFLGKVLKAVNRDIEKDTYLINDLDTPTLKTINKLVDFTKVLVFGMNPKEIGLHVRINPYQLFSFQDKQFLFSQSLNTIANNVEQKKIFWAQLQLMFR